jgi:hypothetical protein
VIWFSKMEGGLNKTVKLFKGLFDSNLVDTIASDVNFSYFFCECRVCN